MPILLVHPSTILFAGPSDCGKAYFLIKPLCNDMLSPKQDSFILVYGEDQPAYRKPAQNFQKMEEVKRPMPKALNDKLNSAENNRIILDNQIVEASNSMELGRLFVHGSHPKNWPVIFSCKIYLRKENNEKHKPASSFLSFL